MTTAKTTRSSKTKTAAEPTVNRYKANPARGEVASIINGKHCLFVPSFQNIVAIEKEIEGSILTAISEMSGGNMIISKVVPMLVHLNDGDPISYDEAFRWIAGAQGDSKRQIELVTICYAVIDPDGNRFSKQTDSEAAENPNE
ncbi:MAG: hypothetical protein EOO38_11905 [Cytophagaceae bacterium]|nr:MAG: hypothetical protein EOO38_11905 [Cytophagaceae bacterium]